MNYSDSIKSRVYFPNLDGLRFVAFLAVFFAHSFWAEYAYIKQNPWYAVIKGVAYEGILGVSFFFVLSGFLITYLLLQERANTGRIAIGAFYMRRILKIWPLYYIIVFVGFALVPFVQQMLGQPTSERGHLLYYILFIGNFDVLPTSAVLGVLWSIAVEEQFYFVWPLIFAAVPVRYYKYIFPIIIAIALPMQLLPYSAEGSLVWSSPFICMADLAMGGWAAYAVFTSAKFKVCIQQLPKLAIIGGYIAGLFFFLLMHAMNKQGTILSLLGRSIFCAFFAFFILEQNYAANSFYKISNFKRISKLGLYTYSLYMTHFLCIYVINKLLDILKLNRTVSQVVFLQTLISFFTSLLVGWLSYNVIEKYFLSLKKKFNSRSLKTDLEAIGA